MHAPLRVSIAPSGRLDVDFEGAGKWGLHSFNCTPSAMAGALWVVLTQTVMPNDKVNDGAHFVTGIHCPRGSWVNPEVSTTAHGNAWYYLVPSFGGLFRALSRAFYARGYVEEVTATAGSRRSRTSRCPASAAAPASCATGSTTHRSCGTRKGTWATSRRGRWSSRCSISAAA
jgi:N-methylhydantoinase B/oxoprolinase/acetone carboxylase alpha subunit